ncbi:hypothetical protein JCM8547_005807 [Rhodosporidiobolus lusitaniae]
MYRTIASTTARQLARTARPQPATSRLFSTSLRTAYPTQGGAAPTTSESSLGTDRGSSLPSDKQEGDKDASGLSKKEQSTNTSASSAANDQKGTGASANKDGISGGGNPLKPGAASRSYHTSAVLRAGKPVEEQSAQHPGKSDIDHLENPSLSEEAVHADRIPSDPLPASQKKGYTDAEPARVRAGETVGSTIENVTDSAASTVKKTADSAADTASQLGDQASQLASKAAGAVKDAFNKATGSGSRSFSTSARAMDKGKPVEEQSAQHPGKSDIDHLENPSMSEEAVHAEKHAEDPLPEEHKSSKKDKANESAGVKDNVREARQKDVDDLPDGDQTVRSMVGDK